MKFRRPDWEQHTMTQGRAVCPHCGYRFSEEESRELSTEGAGFLWTCDRCGNPFELHSESVMFFSTFRKERVEL